MPYKIPYHNPLSPKTRALGIFPVFFFLARLKHFISLNTWTDTLWMCHVSNLTLAIGLMLDSILIIHISILWLIFGLPIWIVQMFLNGVGTLSTFATHLGGLIIALVTLPKVGFKRNTWVYAMAWYLLFQRICYYITPKSLNVNVSHDIYKGWEKVFSSYRQFWIVVTLFFSIALWLIEFMILRVLKT